MSRNFFLILAVVSRTATTLRLKAKHEAIATTADEEERLGAKSFTGLTTQEDL